VGGAVSEARVSAEAVRAALREVVDPEVGVNVVDLGLVYGIVVDGTAITVDLAMTSAACPLSSHLQGEAEATIRRALPVATRVQVKLVEEPPWTPARMNDAARAALGG